MPRLVDEPPDDVRRVLRIVVEGYFVAHERWPVWDYVSAIAESDGLDAFEIVRGLPQWQHGYRSVWIESSGGLPGPDSKTALTMHGLIHSGCDSVKPLVDTFVAALAEAEQEQRRFLPDPTKVVPRTVAGATLAERAALRAGTRVEAHQLIAQLRLERPTWNGSEADGVWHMDLARVTLRPFRDVASPEQYLEALEAVVGWPPVHPDHVELPPLALADAFDHLDLAWRLWLKVPLVRVPRAAVAARLSQPATSAEEFENRCSALADVLGCMDVPPGDLGPGTRPLQRMEALLQARLTDGAVSAVAAVGRLKLITRVRNTQQHSGAAEDNDKARAKLGLPRFSNDWGWQWDHLRGVAVRALADIREAIVSEIDRAG